MLHFARAAPFGAIKADEYNQVGHLAQDVNNLLRGTSDLVPEGGTMRSLVLLALAALAAFPLSAHGRWHSPRRVVVVEAPRYAPYRHWDDRCWNDRWDSRWEYRAWRRHHDCDDERLFLRPLPRPLAPPFEGRVELYIR